jgi:hypothetical protein
MPSTCTHASFHFAIRDDTTVRTAGPLLPFVRGVHVASPMPTLLPEGDRPSGQLATIEIVAERSPGAGRRRDPDVAVALARPGLAGRSLSRNAIVPQPSPSAARDYRVRWRLLVCRANPAASVWRRRRCC